MLPNRRDNKPSSVDRTQINLTLEETKSNYKMKNLQELIHLQVATGK